MSDTIYAYKNKLWKVLLNFQYTGTTVPFTLNQGKYLLICHGAHGGNGDISTATNYGGVAMGVLNIASSTNLYATVGGNGGNAVGHDTPGAGGFNGGGKGGLSFSSEYTSGGGGGGATDIRIGSNSLYSRVIVAGGGGGSINIVSNSTIPQLTGNGGGSVGGFPLGDNVEVLKSYPTQSSGYSFGIGMDAVGKTVSENSGLNGAGGGGGGWYGGFANPASDAVNSSSNGGGGSGYVLTSSSFKPDGYLLGEEYYLTDIFMTGGEAIEPQILICQSVDLLNNGDTIIFPSIGHTENIKLVQGTYKLKCYGGDGGSQLLASEIPRGGYAEGILNIANVEDIFVNVGGSGIGTAYISGEWAMMNRVTTMFNGGGAPGALGYVGGEAGGGATDIRIGSNSLYSRVIVAGGSGGCASGKGGEGGGITGGTPGGIYGTAPGPGTQTESPQSTTYTAINGGFGYGGSGVNKTTSKNFDDSGGAGGGGWYGGSGCQPDGSANDDKGGCGGSGYVLTSSSFKPDGYLLGEQYYLTDTVLTTAGNSLPIGHTQAVIEVISCQSFKMLCHDAEGYKKYDDTTNSWIFISDTLPSVETFNEVGSYTLKSDEGLLNEYDVIFNDSSDKIASANLAVVPPKQKISTTLSSDMYITRSLTDVEYNTNNYDINTIIKRNGTGLNTKITVDVYIQKKDITDEQLKLYCVQIY